MSPVFDVHMITIIILWPWRLLFAQYVIYCCYYIDSNFVLIHLSGNDFFNKKNIIFSSFKTCMPEVKLSVADLREH
jgi:hypothetical protein